VEFHVLDEAVPELEVHTDHVTAERVVLLVGNVGVLDPPVVPRVLVVVEDVLAIKLLVSHHQVIYTPKILFASFNCATSRSISERWLYR
jgi:hypothetical protein